MTSTNTNESIRVTFTQKNGVESQLRFDTRDEARKRLEDLMIKRQRSRQMAPTHYGDTDWNRDAQINAIEAALKASAPAPAAPKMTAGTSQNTVDIFTLRLEIMSEAEHADEMIAGFEYELESKKLDPVARDAHANAIRDWRGQLKAYETVLRKLGVTRTEDFTAVPAPATEPANPIDDEDRKFPIGSRLRSYDSERRDAFIEGTLIGYQDHEDGTLRYRIKVERDVYPGHDSDEIESGSRVGCEVFPPVNGTPTIFGKITNGVEAVTA